MTHRAHRPAVIWGGKVWTRQERRRLTLAVAKRELKRLTGKRHLLPGIWRRLMSDFPLGTLD
jgi:hypothetical protein